MDYRDHFSKTAIEIRETEYKAKLICMVLRSGAPPSIPLAEIILHDAEREYKHLASVQPLDHSEKTELARALIDYEAGLSEHLQAECDEDVAWAERAAEKQKALYLSKDH